MKRLTIISGILFVLMIGISTPGIATAQSSSQKDYYQMEVLVPFTNGSGYQSPQAIRRFHLPSGQYHITLKTVRASWDAPGIADAIPLGLGAWCYQGNRITNRYSWKTGSGFVEKNIYLPEGYNLAVAFDALAFPNARGLLTIQRLY